MIINCKELRCAYICSICSLSLNLANNHNLQQFFVDSTLTVVPDDFMASVSAHGGLVHVAMRVRFLTVEGVISLVRNSPKLITLHLRVSVKNVTATLKKMFRNRRSFHFTADHSILLPVLYCGRFSRHSLWKQGSDLLPLWY